MDNSVVEADVKPKVDKTKFAFKSLAEIEEDWETHPEKEAQLVEHEKVKEKKVKATGKRAEALRQNARNYARKYPDKIWAKNLMYRHGITIDDYNKMLSGQRGMCHYCKCLASEQKEHFHIIHDRVSGEITNYLVCRKCNVRRNRYKLPLPYKRW
jgi:hypothetical protein